VRLVIGFCQHCVGGFECRQWGKAEIREPRRKQQTNAKNNDLPRQVGAPFELCRDITPDAAEMLRAPEFSLKNRPGVGDHPPRSPGKTWHFGWSAGGSAE